MLTQIIFPIIRRWLWLLLIVTVITAGIGYLAAQNQPVTYQADSHLLVGPSLTSPSPNLNDLRAAGQLLETYAYLIMTRPFLEDIISELELDTTASRLSNSIEVTTSPTSQVMDIEVTDSDPERAMLIANAVAERIVALSPLSPTSLQTQLQQQIRDQIDLLEVRIDEGEAGITQLERSLQSAPTSERTAILNQISQERSRLSSTTQVLLGLYQTLQQPKTNEVSIIEPAAMGRPNNPQLQLRVITGALAGIVLTLPVIFAFEFLRGDIKREGDVAGVVPVLGSVYTYPRLNERSASTGSLLVHALPASNPSEEYRRLASEILIADTSKEPYSILVTPIGENSEVSEIAANLAFVLSQVKGDVALIDANLHKPTLVDLFKLSHRSGLSEMLEIDDSASHIPPVLERLEELTIMPAGEGTKTPFATLASPALMHLLEALKEQYKLVVIIAPPFNQYAESLLLASRTDSTILVTHSGSSQSELKEAVESLRSRQVSLVGAIFHRGHYGRLHSLRQQQPAQLPAGEKNRVFVKANHP